MIATSRAEGGKLNESIYYTGTASTCGHNDGRYTVSGRCVTCKLNHSHQHYKDNTEKYAVSNKRYQTKNTASIKEYNDQYRMSNADDLKVKRDERYDKHGDRLKQQQREYYWSHTNDHVVRSKQWRRDNHGKVLALSRRYAANKIQAVPTWYEHELVSQLYEQCRAVSRETGIPHQVDHIIPLNSKVVCGLHCISNLRIITATENSIKSNKLIL